MRQYEKSHPWITFHLDLNGISPVTWMALGEVKSKCEHISNTPLSPEVAKRMHTLFLAKGAQGTTAIEGNTLSEQEVLDRIEGKLELPSSKDYLGKEIDNIVNACNRIRDELIEGDSSTLDCTKFKEFNRMVLDGLQVEENVAPGEIRNHSVGVVGPRYRGAPAEDCEYLVDELCRWLAKDFDPPEGNDALVYGVLKAVVSHVYIAWIHPFGDGNGRTARLVEFHILLASGVPTPAAHLLSNYYNETRQEYYRQLDATSRSGGNVVPFVEYAIWGFVDALREQLRLLNAHVFNVTWDNFIHDQFKNKAKQSDTRRRHLALDISRAHRRGEEVAVSNMRQISPRLAAHYANRTDRTIRRDLEVLMDMGLISITARGQVRPNQEIMLAFLPRRRRE